MASAVIGAAHRMVVAMGLHRILSGSPAISSLGGDADTHTRTWWSLFCLDIFSDTYLRWAASVFRRLTISKHGYSANSVLVQMIRTIEVLRPLALRSLPRRLPLPATWRLASWAGLRILRCLLRVVSLWHSWLSGVDVEIGRRTVGGNKNVCVYQMFPAPNVNP